MQTSIAKKRTFKGGGTDSLVLRHPAIRVIRDEASGLRVWGLGIRDDA